VANDAPSIGALTETTTDGFVHFRTFLELLGRRSILLIGSVPNRSAPASDDNLNRRPEGISLRERTLLSETNVARLTILVVEDDFLVRLTIVEFLRQADCEVVEAASGEAAIAVLQKRDGIDVVFTDIRLGGQLNGWDVAEASRATHPNIPVVYTSGAAVLPERPVSGSIFLEKPYDPAVVLATCRTFCDVQRIASA
jgi:CheY-like chemotaxis protein